MTEQSSGARRIETGNKTPVSRECTVNDQSGRVVSRAGRVPRRARVIAGVGSCDRLDEQHIRPRSHSRRADAHHGRVTLAVKRPVDLHRQVALRGRANRVRRRAGRERLLAKRERQNLGRN